MDESAIRVAVVIPCFNDGATLPETLASAATQEPCEVVVVDDGSTDAATIDLLAKLDVRVVHRENGGPAAARMTGVEATTARYVLPLDADDQLMPGAVTVLADALDAHPEAVAAWGDAEVFGSGVSRIARVRVRTIDPWLVTYVNPHAMCSLMRRAALVAAGGWQLAEGYEDWDLWLALAERGGNGVHVGRLTFRYRVHPGRRWQADVQRHGEVVALLRSRHEQLFRERRMNWRASPAPLRLKLLFPIIDRVPALSARSKTRLFNAVRLPHRLPQKVLRALRRRAGR